jgi:hypothetical protein
MIDKTKIINSIKKEKTFVPQFRLKDGGIVVDTVVDELNRLHYVVKRDNSFTVDLAESTEPVERFNKHTKKHIIITDGVVESVTDEA